LRTSFKAYYNAVASRLELSLSLTNTPTNHENRNINEFASGKHKNSANKGKHSNEGAAKKNPKKGNLNKDFVPEIKAYPNHTWKGLNSVNKEKVRALYRSSRNNNNSSQRQSDTPVGNYNMIPYMPNRQVNNTYSQMGTQMVPYQQFYPDNHSINSVNLTPYPGTANISIPEPPPSSSLEKQSVGPVPINSNTGNVGQQFRGQHGYFT